MSTEAKRADVINKAAKSGNRIVYTDHTTLQLDIDSDADFQKTNVLLKRLRYVLDYKSLSYCPSKSHNHFHIYVTLKTPMPKKERMLLQGLLGSDPIREALNWQYDGEGFFVELGKEDKRITLEV